MIEWIEEKKKKRITHFNCSVGCIQARAPSGSSLSDVIGPRFWFKSPPGGKPNIRLLLLGPDDGYSFRPHSSSSVGHGDAELKQPGTASSERSFRLFSNTWKEMRFYQIFDGTLRRRSTHNHSYSVGHTPSSVCHFESSLIINQEENQNKWSPFPCALLTSWYVWIGDQLKLQFSIEVLFDVENTRTTVFLIFAWQIQRRKASKTTALFLAWAKICIKPINFRVIIVGEKTGEYFLCPRRICGRKI